MLFPSLHCIFLSLPLFQTSKMSLIQLAESCLPFLSGSARYYVDYLSWDVYFNFLAPMLTSISEFCIIKKDMVVDRWWKDRSSLDMREGDISNICKSPLKLFGKYLAFHWGAMKMDSVNTPIIFSTAREMITLEYTSKTIRDNECLSWSDHFILGSFFFLSVVI